MLDGWDMDRKKLKARFEHEMKLALEAERREEPGVAFAHLERAHILGQRWLTRHLRAHFHMLRLAMAAHDRHETSGQIQRLVGTPLAWVIGWVPKGNSGGADVSPFQPMPLPADMADDLSDFSVSRDIWAHIAIIGACVTVAYAVAS